jgi:hypothetical protein
VFVGALRNLPLLRQDYGLTKNANEVMVTIEAFKALRDRGPFPADQVLNHFEGSFAFVLFDSSSKTLMVASVSKAYQLICNVVIVNPDLFSSSWIYGDEC